MYFQLHFTVFHFFDHLHFHAREALKVLFKNKINKRSQDLKQIICDAAQFIGDVKKLGCKKKIFLQKALI